MVENIEIWIWSNRGQNTVQTIQTTTVPQQQVVVETVVVGRPRFYRRRRFYCPMITFWILFAVIITLWFTLGW